MKILHGKKRRTGHAAFVICDGEVRPFASSNLKEWFQKTGCTRIAQVSVESLDQSKESEGASGNAYH